MEGSGKSGYVVTMTDRRPRLVTLHVVQNKSAEVVRKAITQGLKRHSNHPVRAITTDKGNGKELEEHELGFSLEAKTYFANPSRS